MILAYSALIFFLSAVPAARDKNRTPLSRVSSERPLPPSLKMLIPASVKVFMLQAAQAGSRDEGAPNNSKHAGSR